MSEYDRFTVIQLRKILKQRYINTTCILKHEYIEAIEAADAAEQNASDAVEADRTNTPVLEIKNKRVLQERKDIFISEQHSTINAIMNKKQKSEPEYEFVISCYKNLIDVYYI
jgi:hypothetical protein